MRQDFPDPVPLGVSGAVTIPLAQYLAHVGSAPGRSSLLLDEKQRIAYLASRILEALDRPITSPGSEGIARLVLSHFQSVDMVQYFAERAMLTLRDGAMHNFVAVSPDDVHVAVLFVAWNGTHLEVQGQRIGNYLSPLFATARRLVGNGTQLAGILEIDAYLRDNPETDQPGTPLEKVFAVDVEYSYLPGFAFGSPNKENASLPKLIMLNPDLCTPEENQALKKLKAPSS
jgi:hypothetical protein